MPRYHFTGFHFTECPITYPPWSREEKLKVHYFIVKHAVKFSRTSPYLEFGDFYNAGYLGYLRAIKKIKWTPDSSGLPYACTRILGTMTEEWSSWYGRKSTPKGAVKRKALFLQLSIDQPLRSDDDPM